MNNAKLFCESTTVLACVKADATGFKPFVKNKLIEIQDLTPSKIWKYIPSSENKATDLISKGCKYEELQLIINGQVILKNPEQPRQQK